MKFSSETHVRHSGRVKGFLLSEATAYVAKRPSAARYREALSELSLSRKLRSALVALVSAPDHALSVAQIHQKVGWKGNRLNTGGVGLRIGWLGGKLAEKLGLLDHRIVRLILA